MPEWWPAVVVSLGVAGEILVRGQARLVDGLSHGRKHLVERTIHHIVVH